MELQGARGRDVRLKAEFPVAPLRVLSDRIAHTACSGTLVDSAVMTGVICPQYAVVGPCMHVSVFLSCTNPLIGFRLTAAFCLCWLFKAFFQVQAHFQVMGVDIGGELERHSSAPNRPKKCFKPALQCAETGGY